jgi:hypothetical protein
VERRKKSAFLSVNEYWQMPPRKQLFHSSGMRTPAQFDRIMNTCGCQLDNVDLPGGGCPSTLGSLGSIAAHVGAIDVQIVDSGDILFGSSRVPTLTAVKCARLCEVTRTCVPHMGQNRQYMTFPLSAMNENSLRSPLIVSALVLKSALTVPLPPPIVWHIRHQHARAVTGGSAIR